MPDQAKEVVINTTPLIALTAATGNLDVLRCLYSRVIVPYEVANKIRAGGRDAFGVEVFEQSFWLDIRPEPKVLMPYLQNTLDSGEASVIQTALQLGINLVCIDEILGRRTARLSNLNVTGAIGVLLKAKSKGYQVSMTDAISRMREHGIWLSQNVIDFALTH